MECQVFECQVSGVWVCERQVFGCQVSGVCGSFRPKKRVLGLLNKNKRDTSLIFIIINFVIVN